MLGHEALSHAPPREGLSLVDLAGFKLHVPITNIIGMRSGSGPRTAQGSKLKTQLKFQAAVVGIASECSNAAADLIRLSEEGRGDVAHNWTRIEMVEDVAPGHRDSQLINPHFRRSIRRIESVTKASESSLVGRSRARR